MPVFPPAAELFAVITISEPPALIVSAANVTMVLAVVAVPSIVILFAVIAAPNSAA